MHKSFTLGSVALWASLFGGKLVNAAACNADNCLRALFPTQSPAAYSSDAAFCATFTSTIDTRTTGFPSRATAACGTAASRYSSACSCKPTISSSLVTSVSSSTTSPTAPTCTPYGNYNDAVINGDFECYLSPWVAKDIPGTTHKIGSPGDNSKFAYEFDQVGPVSPATNTNPASLSQNLKTVAGVPYRLKFRVYFDKCNQSVGFVGVMINNKAVLTVDACDGVGAGVFKDSYPYEFYASASDTLKFEFLIFQTPTVVKIDNVSVIPLH